MPSRHLKVSNTFTLDPLNEMFCVYLALSQFLMVFPSLSIALKVGNYAKAEISCRKDQVMSIYNTSAGTEL